MKTVERRPKPTLEFLLKESQVITGKDLIKRKEEKAKELAFHQEAVEFERRNPRYKTRGL